ncbi:hypothetical protein [Abyssisolibacter fermentans]|uniref:hypothetical protein n=1 Tax=Abyssisolibacter fermentans TaxID=1766203 RepID=UPI000835FEC2|nr:hypothetical protein [Abyssisolibacter fermentans]
MSDFIDIKQKNISIDKREILNILDYEKDDIIYLGGSLIESKVNKYSKGMGNRLSDIDVFIISSNFEKIERTDVAYDIGNVKTQFKRLYGISIDIEIFSKDVFLNLINELSNYEFDSNTRTFNILSLPNGFDLFKFTSFIHRFLNGIPIYNENLFYAIKKDFNENSYYQLMTRICINNVDVKYEDVIGNIESKQAEVAVTTARTVLLETMKAYIFHKKTSLDRDKWIPIKLKNLAEYDKEAEKIYTRFKKLYFQEVLDSEKSLINNAEKIIDFSNQIISKIGQAGGI